MGYATLGAVIEAVTGDTGSSHIERALFEPLGMRARAASPERRGGLQLAQAYTWRLGRRGAVPALSEVGFDDVRLVVIGQRAGVSKASVYRYFESKEAIFLELLAREIEAWVREAEGALASVAGAGTVDAVARIVADSLSGRPRLGSLAAKLASVLERNVGGEALRTFIRQLALTIRLVTALRAALPSLSVEGAQRFVGTLVTCQNGLVPAAHPPPAVQAVLAEPEFAPFRADDRRALRGTARLLLTALVREDAPA